MIDASHIRMQRGAREQFSEFIEALFKPSDQVEVRAIAKNTVQQLWMEADSLRGEFDRLQRLNSNNFNIYVGVNPRLGRNGTKAGVSACRSVWADLDDISVDDAYQRCRHLPDPSIVVNSGHGVHFYWLLDQPVPVASCLERERFESTLKAFQQEIGSDATHDVTRLLRLPGFLNHKSVSTACSLVRADGSKLIPWSTFSRWELAAESSRQAAQVNTVYGSAHASADDALNHTSHTSRDVRRIRGLVQTLDRETKDRSRRDFWVVCRLLRLGVSPADVKTLVDGKSKFVSPDYLERTIQSSLKHVFGLSK